MLLFFLFFKGEGGAPGLPGIAGPRGGPVSVKDISTYFLTPHRQQLLVLPPLAILPRC